MRYYLVLQNETRCYHQDYGTSQVEAYAKTEAYIHHLRREYYTVHQWPGAPVWDCKKGDERFTVALYEKCDDGEDGGATSPFEGLPADSLELPVDRQPVWVWLN